MPDKYYTNSIWSRLNPLRKRYEAVILIHGGGARTMAHWGALQCLVKQGVEPIGFVTRSGGGMPALANVLKLSDYEVREHFRQFHLDEVLSKLKLPVIDQIKYMAFFTKRFGDSELSSLRIPVYMSAIRRSDYRYVYLYESFRLSDALAASSAIPGLIGPMKVGTDAYYDGDMVGGTDVDFAKQKWPGVPVISICLTKEPTAINFMENGIVRAFNAINGGVKLDYSLDLKPDYTIYIDHVNGSLVSPDHIDEHARLGYETVKAEWTAILQSISSVKA